MTPSNNRKHRAQQKTRPQGSNPGTLTKRMVHDNFMVLEFYARTKIPTKVKSCYRVSILSNPADQTVFIEVKTITKSMGNGIAESFKSCNLHQKGSFKG